MKRPVMRERIGRMNMDVKLRLYTSVLIIAITMVMLIISTVFAMGTLYQKSEEAARSKLSFVAASYGNWLEGNKNTLLALQLAPELQSFCSATDKKSASYVTNKMEVKDTIENQLMSNLDINFISVTNENLDSYVYRGNYSIFNTKYEEAYKKGLEESRLAKKRGSTRVNFGNDFFGGSKYSVTIYQPVYSVSILDKQIGMLCMNINDSLLKYMENSMTLESMQTYLADIEGNLISVGSGDSMDSSLVMKFNKRERGCIQEKRSYYFFQKIEDWNYYVVSVVPMMELYHSSLYAACIMIVIMVLLLLVSILVIRKIVHSSYEQVSSIMEAMDHIARNELDYRIETCKMGEDFEKLGNGFNKMIDEINKLMVTVREEQYQIDQIRLQALQSQIQPHFLYNTLECIHWQSSAEGNKQVSKLVMALAAYYRISLSKGRDIITLREELMHIQYYLIIQNQRYGELITYDTDVPEALKEIRIPKLTLQPLVENAIYHGIRIKEGLSGNLTLIATKSEDNVLIRLTDSGTGLDEQQINKMNESLKEDDEQFGYGVRNVNKRIELLFGKQFGLHYQLNAHGGATVTICLPAEFEHADKTVFEGEP